jgi:hypothetical protein
MKKTRDQAAAGSREQAYDHHAGPTLGVTLAADACQIGS